MAGARRAQPVRHRGGSRSSLGPTVPVAARRARPPGGAGAPPAPLVDLASGRAAGLTVRHAVAQDPASRCGGGTGPWRGRPHSPGARYGWPDPCRWCDLNHTS